LFLELVRPQASLPDSAEIGPTAAEVAGMVSNRYEEGPGGVDPAGAAVVTSACSPPAETLSTPLIPGRATAGSTWEPLEAPSIWPKVLSPQPNTLPVAVTATENSAPLEIAVIFGKPGTLAGSNDNPISRSGMPSSPYPSEPQPMTLPLASRARSNRSPAETSATWASPGTAVITPGHHSPSARTAKLSRSPAVTATTPDRPGTATGTSLNGLRTPSPSWP
jgi:hypothetical protein